MGAYADFVRRLGQRTSVAAVGAKLAHRLDVPLYRLTGGKVLVTGPAVLPTLLLTTTGRRTGEQRTVPLLYGRHGGAFVLSGTNWGRPRDPAWALNLLANPVCEVQVGRRRLRCRARTAATDEREALWALMDAIWPAYATYRARTEREVKVFVVAPSS